MTERDHVDRDYYCQLIKEWHDRIKKATMNVSTHLFKEVLQVVDEMQVHVDGWEHDRVHTLTRDKP